MRRNLPNPLNPRVLHWHIGIEPLGHCPRDECLTLLFEQIDEAYSKVTQLAGVSGKEEEYEAAYEEYIRLLDAKSSS